MRSDRRRFALLCGVLALTLGAGLALRPRVTPVVAEDDLFPIGRWHPLAAVRTPGSAEERARLLSLPYSAAGRAAPAGGGVLRLDAGRAAPGLRLYVSGHAPEAILIDRDGSERRRWGLTFPEAFPGAPFDRALTYYRRAALAPNGDLVALFQGGGLVRLDRHSRLVWAYRAATFNDLRVGPAGEVLTIVKTAGTIPALTGPREVLEDAIAELSPEGREIRRVSLPGAFLGTRFEPLLAPLPAGPDIFHTNTIEVLDGRCSDRFPAFARGNWLVSLREIDTLAVVDPLAGRVVWAQRGPWARQHEPTLLDDCHLLVFDNRGAGAHSRVLEADPATGAITWTWSGERDHPLDSPEGGSCARLRNGDTLVTESEGGRALEVSPDGKVVWEFMNPHRAGRDGLLVATLWEVVLLDSESRSGNASPP